MTPQEHMLMVHMFARQTLLYKSILECLKSRGVLDDSDILAFDALTWETEKQQFDMFHAVAEQYTIFAKALGLEGDLPSPKKS